MTGHGSLCLDEEIIQLSLSLCRDLLRTGSGT
jgi:hypothetical protein